MDVYKPDVTFVEKYVTLLMTEFVYYKTAVILLPHYSVSAF